MNSGKKKWLSLQLLYIFLLSLAVAIISPSARAEYYPSLEDWDEEDLWTLLFQGHCTINMRCEAQATWSWKEIYVVGPESSSSWTTNTLVTRPEDGRCTGVFRRCTWRHEWWLWESEDPWDPPYWTEECFIKTSHDDILWKPIHGSNKYTCVDDIQSFTDSGYDSIEFQSRYESHIAYRRNHGDNEEPETVSVEKGKYWSVGLTVEINVKGHKVSGTLKVKNEKTTTFTYTYYYGPQSEWSIDYLGTQSPEKGYTFKKLPYP